MYLKLLPRRFTVPATELTTNADSTGETKSVTHKCNFCNFLNDNFEEIELLQCVVLAAYNGKIIGSRGHAVFTTMQCKGDTSTTLHMVNVQNVQVHHSKGLDKNFASASHSFFFAESRRWRFE